MEKIQGVKNFGNEGEGRFREILSCPPPKCVLPLKCPPQIPRPGAATEHTETGKMSIRMTSFEDILNYFKLRHG